MASAHILGSLLDVPKRYRGFGIGPLRLPNTKVAAIWREIDRVMESGTIAERRKLISDAKRDFGVVYRAERVIPNAKASEVAKVVANSPTVWASKYHRQLTEPLKVRGADGGWEHEVAQLHYNLPVAPVLPDPYHVRMKDLSGGPDGSLAQDGVYEVAHLEQADNSASRNHFVLTTVRQDGDDVRVTGEATLIRPANQPLTKAIVYTWSRLLEGGLSGLTRGRSPAVEHLMDQVSDAFNTAKGRELVPHVKDHTVRNLALTGGAVAGAGALGFVALNQDE